MNVSFTSKLGKDLAQSVYSLSKVVNAEENPKEFIICRDGSHIHMSKINDNFLESFKVKTLKDHGIENTLNTDEFIAKNESILEKSDLPKNTFNAYCDALSAFGEVFLALCRPTEELKKTNIIDSEDYGWIALANKYADNINSTIKEKVKSLTPEDIDEVVKGKEKSLFP